MSETTGISWTEATFNPWWGCTKVSPACDRCYAERDSNRYGFDLWGAGKPRRFFGDKHWNEPRKWDAKAAKEGRRLRVFCASMADVFDNEVGQEHRERLWSLMRETPNLDWQLVTKRIGNAVKMLPADWGGGYPNAWLLITTVNQDEIDRDVSKLRNTPARIRGLSIEPMLEAVTVPMGGLHWIICGGESGSGFRIMQADWARSLRDQCLAAGVAFHFKQWSGFAPKKLGRELDCVVWDQFPSAPGCDDTKGRE